MSEATVRGRSISRFGSQQRVAELLGIWQTAVSGWVRRGAIPAKRQEQLLTIAQREGVKLQPKTFLPYSRPDGRRVRIVDGDASRRSCAGRQFKG